MLFLNEATVRQLLPMEKAIALLEEGFAGMAKGETQSQPRRRMFLPSGAVLHAMAGATPKYFGTKVYSTQTKPAGAWFVFLLYRAETAEPLAIFEANWLGQIRTGAASGLATKWMARPEAQSVALLGTGFQGASQLDAVLAVRPITEVNLWNRNRERAEQFAASLAERLQAAGKPVPRIELYGDANDAVASSSIVATATFAAEPLFADGAVAAGTHLNAAGSNHPKRAEIPAGLFHRAELTVVDALEQARIEAGDLLLALDEAGWARVQELQQQPKRQTPEGITIFKSVGLGLEDVAVAAYVYEQAVAQGFGTESGLFSKV